MELRKPEDNMPVGEPYGPKEICQNIFVLSALNADISQLYDLTMDTRAGGSDGRACTRWLGAPVTCQRMQGVVRPDWYARIERKLTG